MNHTPTLQEQNFNISDLKSRVPMQSLVEQYAQRSHGKRYYVPWREDHNPSLTIYNDRWTDWGRGESGDQIDWLMRVEGLLKRDAILRLADISGSGAFIPIPHRPKPEAVAPEPPTDEIQSAFEKIMDECERSLQDSEAARNYLLYERNLNAETIRAKHYGWNPSVRYIAGRRIEAGWVIPWVIDGTIWAINVRTITGKLAKFLDVVSHCRNGQELSKYMLVEGSKRRGILRNGDRLILGRPVLIVEGEGDCDLAQQEAGNLLTVVTMGGTSGRLSQIWEQRLHRLGAPIYAVMDNDQAGSSALDRLTKESRDLLIPLKYPKGIKDLTDYINAGGDFWTWFNVQINPCIFADGAPITWISHLMTYMAEGSAFLWFAVHAAAKAGVINPQRFYPQDLYQWMKVNGYPVSQKTFYRYLDAACNDELLSKSKTLFLQDNNQRDSALENDNNSRGRPATAYSMIEREQLKGKLLKRVEARTYEDAFKSDGQTGTKARPRIAALIKLGVPGNRANAVNVGLDRAYQSIYYRQHWAYRGREAHIKRKLTETAIELADTSPLIVACRLIKKQSDLELPIIQARYKEGVPISLKVLAEWTGVNPTCIGAKMRRWGYQALPRKIEFIPIERGQNIKKAAYKAAPHGQWRGLSVDGNSVWQPFEQSIADQAQGSVSLVILQPNAYKYIGVAIEPKKKPAEKSKHKEIVLEASKTIQPEQPSPHYDGDMNLKVDYYQAMLGLKEGGWVYQADTGCWYDSARRYCCGTMVEALQIQAGITIDGVPITDNPPTSKQKIIQTPVVTPKLKRQRIPVFSSHQLDYRAMNKKGRTINPFSVDYDRSKLIYHK